MKTINLNKFSSKQRVIIDENEYTVNGFTMQNYIEDDLGLGKVDKIKDKKKQAEAMIDVITKISDIPLKVLMAQPVTVIHALVQVAQGIDPTKEPEPTPEPAEGAEGDSQKKS